jgi:hypothetical protein
MSLSIAEQHLPVTTFDIVVITSGSNAIYDKRTDGFDSGETTSCSRCHDEGGEGLFEERQKTRKRDSRMK